MALCCGGEGQTSLSGGKASLSVVAATTAASNEALQFSDAEIKRTKQKPCTTTVFATLAIFGSG